MSDGTTINNNSGLISSLNQPSAATTKKADNKSQIGQDEFLQLLITQLKNQDPMDPMKNDQFAVDMAQFTQVEQLMKINDALSAEKGTDLGSLASYLGREVSLGDTQVNVEGGDGGRMKLNVMSDAANVQIELLNADGSVNETVEVGALTKGKHSIALDNIQTTDGAYNYRVKATDSTGAEITTKAQISGIVSGFVPGADPKLLIGSREISPSEITEVGLV